MLGLYDWVIAWDHRLGTAWLISTGLPETGAGGSPARAGAARLVRERLRRSPADVAGEVAGVAPASAPRDAAAPSYPVSGIDGAERDRPALDLHPPRLSRRRGAGARVHRRRRHLPGQSLAAVPGPLPEPPFDLYRRLRRRNPAAFAAYLDFGDLAVLSASPERFLRLDENGRHVETRPIKGTRPRGLGPMHDAALGRALSESDKDRAENVMIVDLLRNDLSRVCRPGTVRVPELFALEQHPTVHHLVSTVVGELDARAPTRSTCSGPRSPAARSPARPRCARWRSSPSWSRRSAGCTAARSAISASPARMDTSIVIRTYLALGGRVYFQAGGGIVADSDPELEYRETLDKARALIESAGGDS